MMPDGPMEMRGMGWRIPASILIVLGWLAFVVIWLFFFASDYNIYKNLAVLFVSTLIGLVVLTAIWIGFGLRMGRMYAPDSTGWTDYRQIRWRAAISVAVVLAWSAFLLIWSFVYADGYTGYQNIAVIFVSLLIAGGLSAAVWSSWWRPYR
jgi:peptidoglycan/LPS O-acetylase OafA/YrhL